MHHVLSGSVVAAAWATRAKILVCCCFYLLSGPVLVVTNKHIIKDLGFHFPMAVASLGLIVTSFAASLLVLSGVVVREKEISCSFWLTKIIPVGAAFATTLACGNAVYLYLTVAFIQICKAFTPCTVMLVLGCSGISIPTRNSVLSVLVICIGTAISAYGEMHLSLTGLFLILCAELGEVSRLVLTQYLLQNLKFGVWEGQYLLAPASFLCITIASAFFEWQDMLLPENIQIVRTNLPMFVWAGAIGLLVNVASFMVIQLTSSVTLKVLNTARTAALVVFCALFLGERVTMVQVVGYSISLCAFGAYNFFKLQELQDEQQEGSVAKDSSTSEPGGAKAIGTGPRPRAAVLPTPGPKKSGTGASGGGSGDEGTETEDKPLLAAAATTGECLDDGECLGRYKVTAVLQ
jgi:hypothetical protein